MKKILHILNSVSYDGAAVLAYRTIELTPMFDHNIVSVLHGSGENEFYKNGLKFYTLLNTKPNGVLGIVNKNLSIINFLRVNNYDVIHFHGGGITVLLITFLLRKDSKVIFHLHAGNITGIPFKLNIPIIHKLIYKRIDKRIEKIATCEHVKKFYVDQIKPTKIKSIHLIKNYSPFNFSKREKLTRTIGYIGRITSEKNIQLFFDIMGSEEFKGLNLKTLLMGDYSNDVAESIREKINTGIVGLLAPSLKVEDFYRKVDILLFPSQLTETLPLVLLEAVSFDVAVIALRSNATEEIFGNYPLLLDKIDISAFLEKILEYYSSDNLRLKLREFHCEVAQKFNKEEYYHKIVKLYSSLVSR